jgi:hypothetical protein
VDDQFTAPDDSALGTGLEVKTIVPSFVDVLIRSRERSPIVIIVLVLLLDEVIKEVAILFADDLSRMEGHSLFEASCELRCHARTTVQLRTEQRPDFKPVNQLPSCKESFLG